MVKPEKFDHTHLVYLFARLLSIQSFDVLNNILLTVISLTINSFNRMTKRKMSIFIKITLTI